MLEYSIMEERRKRESHPVDKAVLGYLIDGEHHGYELSERLTAGLGPLWRVASSQLYSVLHRMEKEGWIACRVEPQGGRPPRRTYRILPKGERAFWAWVTSPVRPLRNVRVEFLAKVYFLRRLAPEKIPSLIDEELRALGELGRRLESADVESDDPRFGEIVLSFRKSQVRSVVDWLKEKRESLEKEVA